MRGSLLTALALALSASGGAHGTGAERGMPRAMQTVDVPVATPVYPGPIPPVYAPCPVDLIQPANVGLPVALPADQGIDPLQHLTTTPMTFFVDEVPRALNLRPALLKKLHSYAKVDCDAADCYQLVMRECEQNMSPSNFNRSTRLYCIGSGDGSIIPGPLFTQPTFPGPTIEGASLEAGCAGLLLKLGC